MAVTNNKLKTVPLEDSSETVIKAARKKDALALAYLIYDMYKEEQSGAKVVSGQNNAIQKPNS